VEANIRDWLSNEFKHQLEHHGVAFKDPINTVTDQMIQDYLDRNDYIHEGNIDQHINTYVQNTDVVTEDSLNDSINEWMSNNFDINDYDIEDSIRDSVRSLSFTVEIN
jgi:hypothetical protein